MRTAFPLVIVLIGNAASGQSPTLTRSNYFDIGDSVMHYFKFDTSLWSASPGIAGENVTWDMSLIDFYHS
ncbi:MAG: hypothetical protein M3R08_11090, partial [Bacteroidota bacterium]|nr:hypothetical protein [Bacteroidota bacterium]